MGGITALPAGCNRVQNGKIKDTRIIMDTLGLMMQLGVFPPPRP